MEFSAPHQVVRGAFAALGEGVVEGRPAQRPAGEGRHAVDIAAFGAGQR